MRIALFVVIATLLGLLPAHGAEPAPRTAGKAVGEFGAGVAESIGAGAARGLSGLQPQWITINPRSIDDCMAESGGVVNPVFVRCRNGWQEQVRYDVNGNKIVLSERPIPLR